MTYFVRLGRTVQSFLHPPRWVWCLLLSGWLMWLQPGMSYYWLIDPALHAQIDAELYDQLPDGETLPGHAPHAPHEHPITLGTPVPDLKLTNPFDAAFYRALLSPGQRPAWLDRRVELAVIDRSITIEPPEQPPRA